MITLSRFLLREQLYESQNSLVFRALRKHDQHPVVVKVLCEEHPSPARIASFKREHAVHRSLNPGSEPGKALTCVAEAYSLERDNGRWVMALEDFGGESLFHSGLAGVLELDLFLEIAARLAQSLGRIHARNVVHKDVTLSNVVFSRDSGEVKVVDFGISTRLSRERTTLRNPRVLEGTLPNMSPEQTGRTNRALDYRTDYYSLGVTLYELWTGQLPFRSTDPLQLVHEHMAKLPVPPEELRPGLPPMVSKLLLRLLEKNAEDRYQSALGLEADLRECLKRWRSAQTIEPFALGREDVSDRFQLPDRLYGRDAETTILLKAFERTSAGATELMLVAGYAGIGKSALVQELYRPITERRGYFITGKFDQLQRDVPYASLIQAFRSLARQLLTESAESIDTWRDKLSVALGRSGGVITEVIPEFELILGPQPPVPELDPAEAENRFLHFFQNFVGVFARTAHPLTVFLDDLQWADLASLRMIESLMTEAPGRSLLLIGAYRDNEISAAHPLPLALERLRAAHKTVGQITLGPLELPHVRAFVADTVHHPAPEVEALGQLVSSMTQGNPFFMGEFLTSLHADRLLAFDHAKGQWRWDLNAIRSREVTPNVVDLVARRIQDLPAETQELLQLAACAGNRFDLGTLSLISERPPGQAAADLWTGISEGLILPLGDHYTLMQQEVQGLEAVDAEFRFAHDRVQQAVYSLIPTATREAVHVRIGQLLLKGTAPARRHERIFDVVNQLNQGVALIDADGLMELARLNLQAGRKARASAAFPAALGYLRLGLSALSPSAWEEDYALALALHLEAAQAAHLCREDDDLERLGEIVLERGRTLVDRIRVYELRVLAYNERNQYDKTLETALHALELLGVSLRDSLTPEQVAAGFAEAQRTLDQVRPEDVASQPRMTDPEKLATVRILVAMTSTVFNSRPQLIPDMAMTTVRLAHEHGYCAELAYGFCIFGLMACANPSTIRAGYHAGEIARKVQDVFDAAELRAKNLVMVTAFIRHWRDPVLDCVDALQDALQLGLETGDLEYAGYGAKESCAFWLFGGEQLDVVEAKQTQAIAVLARMGIEYTLQNANVWRQLTLNLQGKAIERTRLVGEAFDEDAQTRFLVDSKHATSLYALFMSKALLHYLYGEHDAAFENVARVNENAAGGFGLMHSGAWHYYESLIRLALCDPGSEPSAVAAQLEVVDAKLAVLAELATHAPENYAHRLSLVTAERARIAGDTGTALVAYEDAIDQAREAGFVHDEALSFELAAQFYAGSGRPRLARAHLQDAHYSYHRWGAKEKVRALEASFPELAGVVGGTSLPLKSPSQHTTSVLLDFAAVVKSSQAISSEVVREDLLRRMMEIIVECAAAERGALILLGDSGPRLCVLAGSKTQLASIPLAESAGLSVGMVEYVLRTGESVVVGDAARHGRFVNDPYVDRAKPRSILCAPIVTADTPRGAIYLENNLAAHAFSADRLRVIQLLAAQAAISLESANLFAELKLANETLETKVRHRTRELEGKNDELVATLDQLRTLQDRIVTQEKLASLGRLTAGIAHEIKNPLNFVNNFADLSVELLNDLNAELSANATPARLAELSETLELNLSKIRDHGQRANRIIRSMLAHSRGGEAATREVIDVAALLEDYVDLAAASVETEPGHSPLRVERDLQRGLMAEVVPQPLSRVFVNLLDNAIDAALERRADGLAEFVPTLSVSAHDLGARVRISIRDNGGGIPASALDSIYEPFFTTKPPGRGTGLGLSISYEIVTKLHQGELSVESEPGATTFRIVLPKGDLGET